MNDNQILALIILVGIVVVLGIEVVLLHCLHRDYIAYLERRLKENKCTCGRMWLGGGLQQNDACPVHGRK